MLQLSTVEAELSRQGYFSLFDWLLNRSHLAYGDYEAWRYGRIETLDAQFEFSGKELDELVQTVQAHALSLKLISSAVDFYGWDGRRALLRVSESAERHQGLVLRWQRAQDIPQLDLFLDNTSLIAENTLGEALAGRDWEAAAASLQQLTRLNPGHRQLGAYADLLNYGRHMQANMLLSRDALAAELEGLQHEVSPMAKELLRSSARDYLAFAWRRMADNLQGSGFDPEQPQLHLSHALGQIPDWQKLELTLVADPQLYEHPQLLERLARCYSATGQQAKVRALWCLLFDYFPDYAESAVEDSQDQAICALWEGFWDIHDDWQPALFASFVLISEPGLLHHLHQYRSLADKVNLAAVDLLRYRASGENEAAARKKLQSLSPEMLGFYLRK